MKILYVSDLDGTLLNKDRKIDKEVAEKLNRAIDKGINFTVSTGRGGTSVDILKSINLKLPIMLLNGAVNYDFNEDKYIDKKIIPNEKVLEIIEAINNIEFKRFEIQTMIGAELKRFPVNEWNKVSECLSLFASNSKEKMGKIIKALKKIKGINFFVHKKVYCEDEWYCDITPENTSKASSLKTLKEKYGFDKVIAFGDSENDLPLAKIADEFYAVGNAVDIVKQNATAVIGSCYEGGVAEFISKMINL